MELISYAPPVYSFAFQPIVNAVDRKIASYEALIRGVNNESASQVFQQVKEADLYRFDEECRGVAIELACKLGLSCDLNLNFLPLSLEVSETAISSTLAAAQRCGIDIDHLSFEITENEGVPKFEVIVCHPER